MLLAKDTSGANWVALTAHVGHCGARSERPSNSSPATTDTNSSASMRTHWQSCRQTHTHTNTHIHGRKKAYIGSQLHAGRCTEMTATCISDNTAIPLSTSTLSRHSLHVQSTRLFMSSTNSAALGANIDNVGVMFSLLSVASSAQSHTDELYTHTHKHTRTAVSRPKNE